jgi:hypothetical protein
MMSEQGSVADHPHEDVNRERASACLAEPAPLHLFPGIPFEYVEVLKSRGIDDSGIFLGVTRTLPHRTGLATATGIPAYRIEEIRSLCDLSRVRGVVPGVARVLYYVKIRSVEQLARESASAIVQKVVPCSGTYARVIRSMNEKMMADCIRCARRIVLNDKRLKD